MRRAKFIPFLFVILALAATFVYSEVVVRRDVGGERVTVVYWEKWTGSEGQAIRQIVDDFNESQDEIFVKLLNVSGMADKALLATSGGNPPDVAGLWSWAVATYADAEALTDLTEWTEANGLGEDYYIDSYYDQCVYQGRVYALPSTPATIALHVNRDLMPDEADTAEEFPETLEGFDRLMFDITERREDGSIEMAGFLPAEPGWFNWSFGGFFGGELYDSQEGIKLERPEVIRAYAWIQQYAEEFGLSAVQTFQSGFGQFDTPQNAFISGKVAVVLQGVWMARFIDQYNSDLDWFAVPFPYPEDRPDLKNSAIVDLDILVVPKGAKHPEEALEFIKYVQQQNVMEKLCMLHGKNSPLEEVSEEFFATHPNPEIELFDRLARSPNAFAPPQTGLWQEFNAELNAAFEEVNLMRKSPEEAMRDAQNRLQPKQETLQQRLEQRGR
jgi:ABC-type glycerol-3-phosphate transport system substrate-binding protein